MYKKLSRAFENKRQSLKRFSEVDTTSDSQEDTEELDEGKNYRIIKAKECFKCLSLTKLSR